MAAEAVEVARGCLPIPSSPAFLPPRPQKPPVFPLHSLGSPRRSQPRVHGQGEGPRGCRQRGPSQKWRFSAFPGCSRDLLPPTLAVPPVGALGEGARLWEESLRFVPISRNRRGGRRGRVERGARRPSFPSPRPRGSLERNTASDSPSGLLCPRPEKPERAEVEGGGKARGPFFPLLETLSAVDFFFFFFCFSF